MNVRLGGDALPTAASTPVSYVDPDKGSMDGASAIAKAPSFDPSGRRREAPYDVGALAR